MIRFFKGLLRAFTAFTLFGFLLLIGIITLLDPNQFKTEVQQYVEKHSGQTLELRGPLYWHFDPHLSIEAYDVALGSPSVAPMDFLTLEKLRIETNFWSFLQGKPFSRLHLNGLNLRLTQANAHQLLTTLLKTDNPFYLSLFKPTSIAFSNSQVTWKDEFKHQHLQLSDLQLITQDASAKTAYLKPITLSFQLNNMLNPHYSGKVSLQAKWDFKAVNQMLDLQDIDCSVQFNELPDTQVTGTLQLANLQSSPVFSGSLQSMNFALSHWLQEAQFPLQSSIDKVHVKNTFHYQYPNLEITSFALSLANQGIVEGSLKTVLTEQPFYKQDVSGFLRGNNLKLAALPISEINTFFSTKDRVLTFEQIDAEIGNLHHQGSLEVDFRTQTPGFTLAAQISGFEVSDFLALIGNKKKINGKVKGKINLITRGTSTQECLSNLSGQAHLHLTDGKLHGIDLYPLLKHAQQTVSSLSDDLHRRQPVNVEAVLTAELSEWKQQALHAHPLFTPFSEIEAAFTIENGKLLTDKFTLWHSQYTINGHGVIDLLNQKAEYEALALLNQIKSKSSLTLHPLLKETPLSISIQGSLKDLLIHPNLSRYADTALDMSKPAPEPKHPENDLEPLFEMK